MIETNLYNLETYNYSLPKELIAQYPSEKRDGSRLLCYERKANKISNRVFSELPSLLSSNDVLILNDTKVIPARFYAKTQDGKEIEFLLVSSVSPDNLIWKVLASPRKHLNTKEQICVRDTEVKIRVLDDETIEFSDFQDLEDILNKKGIMPLPPYIKREAEEIDIERYQTVFAQKPGAVAAPTAALHFTQELLDKLKEKGVEILYITLHVGPGTFLPIRTEDIKDHKLIPESFYIEKDAWEKIKAAKENKKRIIACGTTTVRALEYAHMIDKLSGLTSLYVTPGFEFKIVDALITNFHLPKTTLLVLVSSFLGWEKVKQIYEEAISQKYRFYSYGDAMFII